MFHAKYLLNKLAFTNKRFISMKKAKKFLNLKQLKK